MSLWFVSKDRGGNGHRKRTGEVLFIDARELGTMINRKVRVLADADVSKIADTYHEWRNADGQYEAVPGFARAVSVDEIKDHNFFLTPGRYVGAEEAQADDEPIGGRVDRLTKELLSEFETNRELEARLERLLGEIR